MKKETQALQQTDSRRNLQIKDLKSWNPSKALPITIYMFKIYVKGVGIIWTTQSIIT